MEGFLHPSMLDIRTPEQVDSDRLEHELHDCRGDADALVESLSDQIDEDAIEGFAEALLSGNPFAVGKLALGACESGLVDVARARVDQRCRADQIDVANATDDFRQECRGHG